MGQVAIWTTDHDVNCTQPTKVLEPAARYSVDDLQKYPVVVVTHAFFSGKRGHRARKFLRDGQLQSRALTVVDERPEEVKIFEVGLADAQRVRDQFEDNEAAKGPLEALLLFMMMFSFTGSSIVRPSDHMRQELPAEQLAWFTSQEAVDLVRAHKTTACVESLFGFAKALAGGYAFLARASQGEHGMKFIGYESNLVVHPGMILLDATADIDGVSQLCPWREHVETPQARYDNLSIVHAPQHTKKRLSGYLKSARNQRAYVAWMVEIIKEHMARGQRGLVVCKKSLFDYDRVPHWPEGDERYETPKLYTEEYGWEIEGRHLCATHWGTGVGANIWKDADVVFLFDEFFMPRRATIATAQGLQGLKDSEGDLGTMNTLNSKAPSVDTLWEGQILRWNKQMALRGRGRSFDEHGMCGQQKLVCGSELKRLVANADRLFPGAKVTTVGTQGVDQTRAHTLLEILSRDGLPNIISTKHLSQLVGTPWRDWGPSVMTRQT